MTHRILYIIIIALLSTKIYAGIIVTNGLSRQYTVVQGDLINGKITVRNNGKKKLNAKAFITDYRTNAKGESFFEDSINNDRSCASWIKLERNTIELGASRKSNFRYVINVPENDNLKGTYWCVIMIEPMSTIDTSMIKKRSIGLHSKIRYAVQVICNIGANGKTEISFKDIRVRQNNDFKYLEVDLENIGDIYEKVMLKASLFNSKGNEVGKFRSKKKGIFPGSSKNFTIDISSIDEGSYKTVLLAECKDDEVFGINVTLSINDD